MANKQRVPLYRVSIGENEKETVLSVLEEGFLTAGKRLTAFEKALKKTTGTPYAVATSSGTAALWALLVAMGVGPGDRVILPALTFAATANAIIFAGATPVLADIDPATYLICPKSVERLSASGAKAVILVHQFGLVCDLEPFEELSKKHGFLILEDAACALGAFGPKGLPGGRGHPAALSFHPRKIATAGEGGAALITNPETARAVQALCNHGRGSGGEYIQHGLNLKLDELSAALGFCQLERLTEFVSLRKKVGDSYDRAFKGREDILCPSREGSNNQSYVLRLTGPLAGAARRLIAFLDKNEIDSCRGTDFLFEHKIFAGFAGEELPIARALAGDLVALPIFPGITPLEQERVIAAVLDFAASC